jgi:hypothetical protein
MLVQVRLRWDSLEKCGSRCRLGRSCLGNPWVAAVRLAALLLLPTLLFAQPFAGERLFCAAFLSRLHVITVLLDFLDDVFLLHFALEAAQRTFQGLTFLNSYFRQLVFTVLPVQVAICFKP